MTTFYLLQEQISSRLTRLMFRKPLLLLSFLVLLASATAGAEEQHATAALITSTQDLTLSRQIFDSHGKPLSGRHDLMLTYYDPVGQRLFAETLPAVEIKAGQLRVELGSGQAIGDSSFETLKSVFTVHPELSLEVAVDGQAQAPQMGVLPAGHSLKSLLIARGDREEDEDDDLHWKHYTTGNDSTAIQSAVLNPAGPERVSANNASDNSFRRRPYTVPMLGPFSSRPVRDLPVVARQPVKGGGEINRPRHEVLKDAKGRPFGTVGRRQNDVLALDSETQQSSLATPSLAASFEGIANPQGYLPPDTEGAVGPNHYVQAVNVAFAIYDKTTGTLLQGPVATNTLWAGFGGVCESNNSGDAIFMYDEQADRWVLSQFAVQTTYTVCFAVSKTSDPLGEYWLYEVDTPRFPDYYKLGVWPDPDNNAYFMGTNSGTQGAYDVFALDRESMLAGASARPMQFFQSFVNLMMPADLDAWQGGVGAPPAGSPGLFYTIRDEGESYLGSPPTDSIDVWAFDVDWNVPSNTTFNRIEVITPADGLADFNWTLCGFFEGNCPGGNAIPQPGTSQKLDSASWWPMQRLVYQNYGSHQSLFGSWTVDVLASGDRAAPRWFELRKTGGNWFIHDQGTHSPDAIHRWMPSIAADISGNIAMGYSRGDANNYAAIYYVTREANDPPGTLQTEALMQQATGAQTSSSGRWGDYSSMELDPVDGCTFWFTTEYLQSTGGAPWRTRIASFSLPSCGGPRFGFSCSPSSFEATLGEDNISTCTVDVFNGYADFVDLSCTGLPTGITCAFEKNNASAPYSSQLTIAISGSASLGENNFTVEATDGVSTKPAPISVSVFPIGSNGPQEAQYNSGLGAPVCSIAGSKCDSTTLLEGRANLGPEPNQPNTIDSCTDGASGTYLSDESIERLVVRHIDGVSNMTDGAVVVVEATVNAWSTGSSDTLDLYYAADADNPNWIYIGSQTPPAGGTQTLTAQYTLPTGGLQAIRANFRYNGNTSTCSPGNYDDRDDLVFAVQVPSDCTVDADCDNGLYCDGSETCNAGVCQAGSAPACDDGLFCNGTESCNETTDSCDVGSAPACDNGQFCDGTETCNEGTDSCDAGTAPTCDDGAFCNGTESCNESTDSCDAGTAPACDDGAFCNGTESCNEGTDSCDAGTPVVCDDGLFCNGTDICNEGTDSCDTGAPPVCNDGLFCNGTETCNEGADSCDAGTPVVCGSDETCDEVADVCVASPVCDNDGVCEAGETCSNCANDCIGGTAAGAICGNGICEAGDSENATTCPADCNGIVSGKPSNRFSCGFGDTGNNNSVGCSDARCTAGGYDCTEIPAGAGGDYCCGDEVCSGPEDILSCALDCDAPPEPFCGDGIINLDEQCDGSNLGGATCTDADPKFLGGELACFPVTCLFDTTSCSEDECVPTTSKEKGPRCSDGIDNDCDGLTDGEDPDC